MISDFVVETLISKSVSETFRAMYGVLALIDVGKTPSNRTVSPSLNACGSVVLIRGDVPRPGTREIFTGAGTGRKPRQPRSSAYSRAIVLLPVPGFPVKMKCNRGIAEFATDGEKSFFWTRSKMSLMRYG
jgi:hypothetical protein